jgi:hypothetical protein
MSMVTVYPLSIVTTSPATGALTPAAPPDVADHVVVALQLPVATEKRFAAIAVVPMNVTIDNSVIR